MNSGFIAALVTAIIWGLTFVSTKTLLMTFTPVEILFIRFLIGFMVLFLIYPKRLKTNGWREEKYFIIAGVSGIFLYYFLENASLLWTTASNAGVIVSTAPIFTALLAREKKDLKFFIGFAAAIAGILMISLGSVEINTKGLLGDFLALLAALVWGIYSVVTKKISTFGYPEVQTARRSFLYGMFFIIIPLIFWNSYGTEREVFTLSNISSLIFLGAIASALCFVLWNIAIRKIGAVKTSVFLYLVPVTTVLTSAIFLGERLSLVSFSGTILALLGLILSSK